MKLKTEARQRVNKLLLWGTIISLPTMLAFYLSWFWIAVPGALGCLAIVSELRHISKDDSSYETK
jgi:F0F1-type ATP synthase assembly protein I